jgi:N-acetylmuramoyl-L-alanine amidase
VRRLLLLIVLATSLLTASPAAADEASLRTIAIDPGHGGPESGAATGDLVEKELNLRIGLILADLLREDGYRVAMTRDDDSSPSPAYVHSGVRAEVVMDLGARVDAANAAGADLFLSIHNNGSADPGQRGTEVWYNHSRSFSDRNLALAELVLDNVVGSLRAAGHSAVRRGLMDDAEFRIVRGRAFNLFVLGPSQIRTPTQMPGVLGESLFLSNPADAAALRRPEILAAIASGYRDAVRGYFGRFPD